MSAPHDQSWLNSEPENCSRRNSARLRDCVNNQYARHDREAGKMSSEKGFVDRDVLDRDDTMLAREINHAVNQQKGKPVGQDAQYVLNVQLDVLGFGCPRFGCLRSWAQRFSHAVWRNSRLLKGRDDYTLS